MYTNKYQLKTSYKENPCVDCMVKDACSLLNDDGEFSQKTLEYYNKLDKRRSRYGGIGGVIATEETVIASKCRKQFPRYTVSLRNSTKRHVLVGKTGNEIFSSDSFLGLVGLMLFNIIISGVIIAFIGLIASSIGSLFQ